VLLLINGMSAQAAESFCLSQGQDAASARETVAAARKRITVAADYTRDEQIGRAVMRLDDLYAKSIAAQDIRTALQAQRELNRLLDLYAGNAPVPAADGDDDASALRRRLDLIAAYLLPLNLAAQSYPVEEHARVAAQTIRRFAGVREG